MVPLTAAEEGGLPPGWWTWAVALPGCLAAICGLVWLLAAALGIPPGADGRTMTLSEGMVVASHADVALLLQGGADPNAPARVRAGLVGLSERTATPLEAATASIRTGPVPRLLEAGAVIDERTYPILWCAASKRLNREMISLLESRRPAGVSTVDCSAVRSVW